MAFKWFNRWSQLIRKTHNEPLGGGGVCVCLDHWGRGGGGGDLVWTIGGGSEGGLGGLHTCWLIVLLDQDKHGWTVDDNGAWGGGVGRGPLDAFQQLLLLLLAVAASYHFATDCAQPCGRELINIFNQKTPLSLSLLLFRKTSKIWDTFQKNTVSSKCLHILQTILVRYRYSTI